MKYKRLTSKKTFQYKGKVYDLEVKDVHSYNIDGLIVHNSGAGSLLNYALDITQVDPLEYDLFFERFLNPRRVGHVPDIDGDTSYLRSDEIYDFLNQTFGKNHCCNIATFQYMKPKAALRDIARVFEIPLAEVDFAAKKIDKDAKTFDDIKDVKEVNEFLDKYENYHLRDYLKTFMNLPKSVSQHPAGIVITPSNMEITDLTPVAPAVETSSHNTWYRSMYCKDEIEQIGGMKYDILRLRTMDIICDELNLINKYYHKDLKQMSIPLDNDKAWDLICDAKYLRGVFQMDGAAAVPVIKKIKPRTMEELSAVNAFIRPGTSGLDEYCAAKKDPSKLKKIWPAFDKILEPTMGGIVYQEQVMGLIAELLGIDFGEADIYRRALEKPDKKKNIPWVEKFNKEVIPTGLSRGIPEKACKTIAQAIIDNSAYLFNKSHSVCYSYIAYWCAWVKANYPLVFFTVLFNNEKLEHFNNCMQEARAFNIDVRPPDISASKFEAKIENIDNNSIRMGLNCIKGLGAAGAADIMNAQPFSTIQEFFEKTGSQGHNKRNVDVCIQIGAFESLPLQVPKDIVDDKCKEFIKVEEKDDCCLLYMNRAQQRKWFESYQETNSKTSIPNYLVDLTTVAGKYLNAFGEDELIKEKKNPNCVVVPEPFLEKFGKIIDDVEKTRCKPKGIFEVVKEEVKDKFVHAFVKAKTKIYRTKFNKVKCYLDDLDTFEISFIDHPFKNKKHLKSLEDIKDGDSIEIGGLIKEVVKKRSKKGNEYYRIILITPLEIVGITMWNDMYKNNSDILKKGNLLVISGDKGYGGLSAKYIDHDKVKKINEKWINGDNLEENE